MAMDVIVPNPGPPALLLREGKQFLFCLKHPNHLTSFSTKGNKYTFKYEHKVQP